jgi:carbohydrate kinase (thermoresistant glucokinase family)
MVVVIMGPSGVGKTTVGQALAQALGWTYVEGDDLHPPENLAKLARGEPLTDADRAPWLQAVRQEIVRLLDDNGVVTCSALKETYRARLRADERVRLVDLMASQAVLVERLHTRPRHFANPAILSSQLAAHETATQGITVDASGPVQAVVAEIRRRLGV